MERTKKEYEIFSWHREDDLRKELHRLERYKRNGVAKYDELHRITELRRRLIDLELENENDEPY